MYISTIISASLASFPAFWVDLRVGAEKLGSLGTRLLFLVVGKELISTDKRWSGCTAHCLRAQGESLRVQEPLQP